jgi:copper chaperone CopZ
VNNTANTSQPVVFDVQGMSCDHCVRAVASALAAVPDIAVRAIAIGYAGVTARNPAAVNAAISALAHAGYSARARDLAATPRPATGGCKCCGDGHCD